MLKRKGLIYKRGFDIIITFMNDCELGFIILNFYHN